VSCKHHEQRGIRPSSSSAAIASIGLAIGRLLREVRDEPFWLFGGQVETIVLATLLGILGAIARRAPTT
jgi:hypothetical protein